MEGEGSRLGSSGCTQTSRFLWSATQLDHDLQPSFCWQATAFLAPGQWYLARLPLGPGRDTPTLLGHYLSIMRGTKLLTTGHSQGLTHTKPANPQHRLYLPLQNYSFLGPTVNRQLRISKHLQAAVSPLWESSFCFLKCVLAPCGRDIGFHVLCPLAGSGPLGYFGHFL